MDRIGQLTMRNLDITEQNLVSIQMLVYFQSVKVPSIRQ